MARFNCKQTSKLSCVLPHVLLGATPNVYFEGDNSNFRMPQLTLPTYNAQSLFLCVLCSPVCGRHQVCQHLLGLT